MSFQQQNGTGANRNSNTQQQPASTQQQPASAQQQSATTQQWQEVSRPWANPNRNPWASIESAHPRLHYYPNGTSIANIPSQQLTTSNLAQLGQDNTLAMWEHDNRHYQRDCPWDGVGRVPTRRTEGENGGQS